MSELHKFLFQGLPVRGMLVRLTDGWRELLARRDGEAAYPPPVRTLLGEMAAAGVLMQADTKLVLAANDEVAAGLLIQRLPVDGAGNLGARNEDEIGLNEAYNRIAHLASTLTPEELLTLDAGTVLHRLFWEEDLLRFEPLQPKFLCTCSRERVSNMLKGLGREEVDGIIEERGNVEVGCDFCGEHYHFDAVDVGELFTPERDQPPSPSVVH